MNFEDNKGLFLEEARDFLPRIENGLIALEKQPGNMELINEVFRGLHTIKGSGAMFGFDAVADFTHLVENLFDEVRSGRRSIDPFIIDVGLRSVDCIALLLEGSDGGEEQRKIISDIEGIRHGEDEKAKEAEVAIPATSAGPAGQSLPPPESSAQDSPERVYRITFKPQRQLLHRGVRLESLFKELLGLGACHVTAVIDAVPALEELEPTALHISWVITVSTCRSLEDLCSVFIFVEDYSELAIEPVELHDTGGSLVVPKLGQILVERGLIGEGDVDEIRQAQKPFGELAIDKGKVSKANVESALAEQAMVRTISAERDIRQESATIRVKKEKLDSLIDLVGELVILQAMLEQEARKESVGVFASLSENLARLSADLRDTIMSIRMVPLEEFFTSFQRLVRDLSQQVGKQLRLEISGGSTELDKNVIELLKDPLVHIIRNSADHGIESPEVRERAGKAPVGTIAIGARQVGPRVEITISDDGAGLNVERIRALAVERRILDPGETDESRIMAAIFEPGFSTAERTTGISGRGVGMDVVKRNIERLRGEISLKSEYGKGMTVILSIPLTLVIIEGLLVRIGGNDYVISLSQVQECVDRTASARAEGGGDSILNLRGVTVPIVSLRESLMIGQKYDGMSRLVIVNCEGSTVGLEVDAVIGRKQVVIKPLSSAVRRIKAISGATILGDGSVALILDVAEIVRAKENAR
jgi:two-component system chemotaxis sensor kinase CheA